MVNGGAEGLRLQDIQYVLDAHTNHAVKPSKAWRKHDGQTPYWTHPLWCATTILAETRLEPGLREQGSLALFYHDILEDTTKPLPDWLPGDVKYLVREMTFPGGMEEERVRVWERSNEVRLLKLYDKVNNLLDGSWMDATKAKTYVAYTKRLCAEVRSAFGELNITRMADAFRGVC